MELLHAVTNNSFLAASCVISGNMKKSELHRIQNWKLGTIQRYENFIIREEAQ